ncbi:tetratricopeptide repeat protein 41-like [Diadema setosum]|uniref:tetratricopeptide repeat protein 41-like n=1 Tax=Diadema setosum TaxID=31175 RepID=UPI003B3A5961
MEKSRPKIPKSIQPFISSTFLDFQEEREHLMRYVFPQLNSVCHARGTYFAPVDLRWGINDEQAQSGNALALCLEYVNRCSPFFIGLLGERYGKHRSADAKLLPSSLDELPENASLQDRKYLVAASKGYDWVLQEAYQYRSVTELEIIQGAFLNDSKFCRFYIRKAKHIEDKFLSLPDSERQEKLKIYHAENGEAGERVSALKFLIEDKGLRVKSFRTPKELCDLVREDWMEVINELCPPLDDIPGGVDGEHFREWTVHEAYAETRRRVFVKTPEIGKLFQQVTDHCKASINTPTTSEESERFVVKGKKITQGAPTYKSIITLAGERGCGKTSLVANWVWEFQSSHPNVKVLAHYVGSSALSTDIRSFLRRVTYEMRCQYGGDPSGQAETGGDSEDLSNFHRICEAFVAAIAMGPCILVLDATDELGNTMGMGVQQVKELKWLPTDLPAHCKIIITTIRSDPTYESLSSRQDSEVLAVPLFTSTEDKTAVIKKHLEIHCKCLDDRHLETIVKCKMSSRPLFLTILASELRACGTFQNLSTLLDRYVSAPSFQDLWKCIISRWTQDYGWSTEGRPSALHFAPMHTDAFTGWVAETLRLMVCSRHGLSEADILDLLQKMGYRGKSKVTSFDFALFRSEASEALVERPGGLFGFFHQEMRDAVLNSLLEVKPVMNRELGMKPGNRILPRSLGVNDQIQQCHKHLAEYFLHQPASRRRVEELPYHLDRCGDMYGLSKVITDPDTFLTMQADTSQNIALKLDLLHYCNRLTKENFNVTESLTKMVASAVGREDNSEEDEEEFDEQKIRCKGALLAMHVGKFLAEKTNFTQANEMLMLAYNRIIEKSPLTHKEQLLLVEVQESIGERHRYELRKDDAKQFFNKALNTLAHIIKEESYDDIKPLLESKGRLLSLLGNMAAHDGQLGAAEEALVEASECMKKAGSVAGIATAQFNLGFLKMKMKQYGPAQTNLQEALQIREQWYGTVHPLVAEVLNELAGLLGMQDNKEGYDRLRAESYYRRALKIREDAFGDDHVLFATTLYHLGKLLRKDESLQSKKESLALMSQALDIRTTKFGAHHELTHHIQDAMKSLEEELNA